MVIHMKMNCAIIKDEMIAHYVLIKLIVTWKQGKRWISDYWVIWRDGIFIFICSRLMLVNKMRQLFLLHLVAPIINILNLLHDYVQWCWVFQISGLAVVSIFYKGFFCRIVCQVFFTILKRRVWYQIFHHRIDTVDSHKRLFIRNVC